MRLKSKVSVRKMNLRIHGPREFLGPSSLSTLRNASHGLINFSPTSQNIGGGIDLLTS